jgi:hypothetical protein
VELLSGIQHDEGPGLGVVRRLEEEDELVERGIVDGEVEVGTVAVGGERELDRAGLERLEEEAVVDVQPDLVNVTFDEQPAPAVDAVDEIGLSSPVVGLFLEVDGRLVVVRAVPVVRGAAARHEQEGEEGGAGTAARHGEHGGAPARKAAQPRAHGIGCSHPRARLCGRSRAQGSCQGPTSLPPVRPGPARAFVLWSGQGRGQSRELGQRGTERADLALRRRRCRRMRASP